MQLFSPLDIIGVLCFVGAWIAYAVMVERTRHGRRTLNARMDRYRETWMRRMLVREMRMVDTQIMASLQNGTAFFASTSLIAIGGALTLLRSTEEIQGVVGALPFGIQASRELWEAKTVGLVFAYAFFKFAWSYRLYAYGAILLGAMPFPSEKDAPESEAHVLRTAGLFDSAGRHFNRGQRAFFFALGYLGWFIGPLVLIFTTVLVLVTMWRRQYVSDASSALDIDTGAPTP